MGVGSGRTLERQVQPVAITRTRLLSLLIPVVVLAVAAAYALTRPHPPALTPPILSPSPTPTPSPSPAPSPPTSTPSVATATPSPTPTATPTALAPALPLADLLWLEDYTAAEAVLRNMLANARPEGRGEVAVLLARVLVAQGRAGEAARMLAPLLSCRGGASDCPQVPPEAHMLLARAFVAAGHPEEAIAAYRAYLATGSPSLLAAEAHAALARLWREQGEHGNALAAYEQAIALAPADARVPLELERAAYLVERNDLEGALEAYTQVLQRANVPPSLRARAFLGRGQVYLRREEADSAYADLLAAVEEAVHTGGGKRPARVVTEAIPFAHQALVLLVAAGVDVDAYTRGVVDVEAGAYWPAINVLIPYLDTVPDHFGDAHAYLARALAAVGNTAGAMEQWRVLIDTHPECPCWADAWFALARLYRQTRQDARARSLMRELSRHPRADVALRERARLYIADQYLGDGDISAAAREYASLAYEARTEDVRNRAALLTAVLSLPHRPTTAIDTLNHALAPGVHAVWSGVLRYWLGKAYLEAGERARAVSIWRELARERPRSYYAFRAAEQLVNLGEHVLPWTPPPLQLAGRAWPMSPTAAVNDLLARHAFPSREEDMLRRAAAYETVGLDTQAYALYNTVITLEDSPARLLALGEFLQARGFVNLGTRAALSALNISGVDISRAPAAYWRLLYPLPARDYVTSLAEEFGVDTALLYALIRQESHFATRATSKANARGLMQLIPATAQYAARALGLAVESDADLYAPTLNLRLGTFYFAEALRRFDGHVVAALAGYNAGPGNAAYWIDLFGDDPDRFIELVPVLETRTYMREVLRQWRVYQALLNSSPG